MEFTSAPLYHKDHLWTLVEQSIGEASMLISRIGISEELYCLIVAIFNMTIGLH